ncbi:hypothetical protein [Maribacter sp. 2-571]|uniref:hypothetical protein n=1 Tax=Maribacter sp. 2-571 TaxID=3417569 RepID=UPI003D347E4A
MGLAERRVVKAFQENEYNTFLEELKKVVGKEVTVNVAWDSLAIDGMSHLYEKAWPKVYFQPLLQALESICADDMGKEAIAESLEKLHIKNEAGVSYAAKWASFENKELTLDHKPTTNIDQIDDRAKALQTLLENNL